MEEARLQNSLVMYSIPIWDQIEYRADDTGGGPGILSGPAIVYGDISRRATYRETFSSGAFGDLSKLDIMANVMHDRARPLARTGVGLTLTDKQDRMDVEIVLDDTTDGLNTLKRFQRGILRGLSVEFAPTRTVSRNGILVRSQARLLGIGVVDRPAYPMSTAELRMDIPVHKRRFIPWL